MLHVPSIMIALPAGNQREKRGICCSNNLCSACVMHVRGRSRKKKTRKRISSRRVCIVVVGNVSGSLTRLAGWVNEGKKENFPSSRSNHCARALFTTFYYFFFCTNYIKRMRYICREMVNRRNLRPQPTRLKGTGRWHHNEMTWPSHNSAST